MIQELFIGGGEEETKISINGERGSSTTSLAPTATSSNPEKLRCPRCDSSNTKFCYYNNYNLTQPRHFCKTCRRYWTKGGALRNVPIGGGCRKNRSSGSSNSAAKTSLNKMKAVASDLGRSSGLGLGPGLDHGLPQSPIIWGSPQNSHLLALLRANQNPNTEPLLANELMNPRALSYHNDNGVALCNSLWRENQVQNNGFSVGEHQNSGIQEIYHKLRSSSSSLDNPSTMFFGNLASTSSRSLSNFSELSSVSGSEFGCWNPTLCIWSDLPKNNGSAYP